MKNCRSLFFTIKLIKNLVLINLAFVITQAMGMEKSWELESDATGTNLGVLKKLRTNPEKFTYGDMKQLVNILGSAMALRHHTDETKPDAEEILYTGSAPKDDFIYRLTARSHLDRLFATTDSIRARTNLKMSFNLEEGPTLALFATNLTYKLTTKGHDGEDNDSFFLISYFRKETVALSSSVPVISRLQRRKSESALRKYVSRPLAKPHDLDDILDEDKKKEARSQPKATSTKSHIEDQYEHPDPASKKRGENDKVRAFARSRSTSIPVASSDVSPSASPPEASILSVMGSQQETTPRRLPYLMDLLSSSKDSEGHIKVRRHRGHTRQLAAMMDFMDSSSTSESSSSPSSSSTAFSKEPKPD